MNGTGTARRTGRNGTMVDRAAELVGKAAMPFYDEMGISVCPTSFTERVGIIFYGGEEAYVRRLGLRSWEVNSEGHRYVFGSQWDLFAWIGDRL